MTNLKIRSRTIVVLLTLAAISAASGFVFQNKASAFGLSGKIYTSLFDGQSVPVNRYSSKNAVYLNGGRVQENSNGLPDGTYYYQVTGPSGNDLLSTDPAVCRQLAVFDGVIVGVVGPACQHTTGIPQPDGSTPVKLMPFIDTPNPGGNYKAWLISQTGNTSVASDGIHINFQNNNAKSEVFRVEEVPCPNCTPTVSLGGRQFYDLNQNMLFDQGEALLAGVQMLVAAGNTTSIVTTNGSGIWSTTVPTGEEYLILEYVPDTGPGGEPGSYWQQTSPVADTEGVRRYQGIANANLISLNFGNICFAPDSEGSPVAQVQPCPVSYQGPPPEPTPTPMVTPTPCSECDTTSDLSGQKFYDANANAVYDVGETTIQGVQIAVVVTTGDGTTTVTYATTNADGYWTVTVPNGAQFIMSEVLPDTHPVDEPNGFWEQTGPLPNDEGFRGYSGTVTEDQGGFNFGNRCFHYDFNGNATASPTPCSVWYQPPPEAPTPTPTPSPTPDNQ